jgi:type I restriction enzyme S subunit
MVPLGKLIRQVSDPHAVRTDASYKNFGIYSFGRGLFHKPPISGATTSARTLYRVRKGQFIYSRLFAFEGAYGYVASEFDGFYVSNEYPTFECDPDVLDVRFLVLFLSKVDTWQQAAMLTTGMGHRRQRIPAENLLRFTVPLPPISEQKRIVELTDVLIARIKNANELREAAIKELSQLEEAKDLDLWPLSSLSVALPLEGVTRYLARGRQSKQGESDHYLIKTQHVHMRSYITTRLRLSTEVADKVHPDAVVQDGDILMACSAAGCLGRVARYQGDGRVASTDTHVAIIRPNPSVVNPDYLYFYLSGAQGQFQIRSRERGDWQREKVGFRLTELNLNDLKTVPVPVPSMREQQKIVSEITEFNEKKQTVLGLQRDIERELNAVRPAILDRAFRGEL